MRTSYLQIKLAAIAFVACLVATLFAPAPISAHEPITTKILFNKEVVRVLQRNCLGCHRPGGIAPMSLATYEEARPWAKAIKEELLEKRMPPCSAVKGFGDFRNSFPITQREIDLIVNWVEGGAPAGKTDLLPEGKLYNNDWALGKPDLVLKAKSPQTVRPDADEYREFVIPIKAKESVSMRALDLRPENRSVVHCATFFAVRIPDKRAKAEKADATDGPRRILGTWVPGQSPLQLPEGFNYALPAGSAIVARIHYRGSGTEAKDQSEIGLYLSKITGKPIAGLEMLSKHSPIPAGANRIKISASATTDEDLDGVAILPRSVQQLLSMQATAYRPDGSVEILVWTRGNKFDWQPTLVYKSPVSLPRGTRVELLAYFDNSSEDSAATTDPPKELRWPNLSPGPMCVLFVVPAGGAGKIEPTQAHRQ
jgi:hypothetical protein